MQRNFLIPILLLISLALATPVFAQQPTPPPDDVNRVAHQLYCPVCENTPLDVCPTQACAQWRALIGEKISAGWTDDQIKQYFVEQYGARVLAEPPIPIVYIVPPILLLIGIFILYRAFQSMSKRKPAVAISGTNAPAPESDEYLRRVEEEIKKRN
jgi:cytochrome c-type biogenesis protein CcmH